MTEKRPNRISIHGDWQPGPRTPAWEQLWQKILTQVMAKVESAGAEDTSPEDMTNGKPH